MSPTSTVFESVKIHSIVEIISVRGIGTCCENLPSSISASTSSVATLPGLITVIPILRSRSANFNAWAAPLSPNFDAVLATSILNSSPIVWATNSMPSEVETSA